MAFNYNNLTQLASFTVNATESIVYAAPNSSSVEVASIWMHNSTANPVTTQVWFPFTATVPTGAFSASFAIERLSEALSGSATLEIAPKVPFVLNGTTNDKITMKATQSGSITVALYGRVQA